MNSGEPDSDRFLAFVQSLDVALEADSAELPPSAPELAALAFLSRFHFDRIVRAVAGEPPAAFRRRVLLERAAYRLLTSDIGVLDVAVQAGYGSHESFTRAFQRAFGQVPSRWRHSNSSFRIHAPSGVHFNPPGGLRVPATGKVSDMQLLVRMVQHHVWLVGEILDRAANLDDEILDRPIELSVGYFDDHPTIRNQLNFTVVQEERWGASIEGRVGPEHANWDGDTSIAGLRARHQVAGQQFVTVVTELLADGRLDETFVDVSCEPPAVYSYGGMIAHVLTFGGYRRELLLLALSAAGVDDLGIGDPRQWVAEPA